MGDAGAEEGRPAPMEIAAGLLGSFGPVDGGVRVQMPAVEAALGVSRTTVYRIWPSTQMLASDLVLHAATGYDGWFRRIVRADVNRSIRASVAAAIQPETGEVPTRYRALLATCPEGSRARERAAAWEQSWLVVFSRWLERALAAAGVRPRDEVTYHDVAVLVAGLIEGQLFTEIVRASPGRKLESAVAAEIAQSVELMLWAVTVPADQHSNTSSGPRMQEGSPLPLDGPSVEPALLGGSMDDLLDADRAAGDDPDRAVLAPTRLVDPGRMARRLDVTTRRLRMLWPTNASFNGDLVEHLLDFQIRGAEAQAMRAMPAFAEVAPLLVAERDLQTRNELYLDLAAPVLDGLVRHAADVRLGSTLAIAAAVLDEAVACRAKDVLDHGAASSLVLLRAIFQAAELHLRPGLSPGVYTRPLHGLVIGLQRMAVIHPGVGDRLVGLPGRTQPLFGFGFFSLYHGLACDAVNDGQPHEHQVIPRLEPLSRRR